MLTIQQFICTSYVLFLERRLGSLALKKGKLETTNYSVFKYEKASFLL